MWIFVYICIIKDNNNQTEETLEQADAGAAATDEPVEEGDAGAAATPSPVPADSAALVTYSRLSSTSSWEPLSPLPPPPSHVLAALMRGAKGLMMEASAKPKT